MSKCFEQIVGNKRIIQYLKSIIKSQNSVHAYVITSSDEMQITEIAEVFAKGLLCKDFDDDVCNKCVSCRSFDSMNNPDVTYITYDEGKKVIGANNVRENIVETASLKPYSNKNKIYVIKNADCMTETAQNALLKVLEEPNCYTKIILIVSNIQKILLTILSRCILINAVPLNREEQKMWIKKNNISIDDNKLDFLLNFSDGSISKLYSMLNDPNFTMERDKVIKIADKLISDDIDDFIEVKQYLTDAKEEIDTHLTILETWYRDVLFVKNNILINITNVDMIETLRNSSNKFSEDKLLNVISEIGKLKVQLRQNANYKLALEVFQINISEVCNE